VVPRRASADAKVPRQPPTSRTPDHDRAAGVTLAHDLLAERPTRPADQRRTVATSSLPSTRNVDAGRRLEQPKFGHRLASRSRWLDPASNVVFDLTGKLLVNRQERGDHVCSSAPMFTSPSPLHLRPPSAVLAICGIPGLSTPQTTAPSRATRHKRHPRIVLPPCGA